MELKQIASFAVDHTKLVEGMYTSRVDGDVTTYDIRMVKPNCGTYLPYPAIHSFEHLFATYVRSSELSDQVIYVGPMGCRTGFYLLLSGDYTSSDIVPLIRDLFAFIADFDGEVPGASPKDCGNYLDMNLPMARYYAKKYLRDVLNDPQEYQLIYPE